ncbi:2-succinyl-5-enolpyruvyl-6-hydroxy-3-cyclohexene-1-carboxylic-acid synthase [Ureibacillus sinduriensis]|uniref:2-succinyl-5-enolpyruvyl-6-hydroxy-3-cyclohexene-1-carboxylate synthase n=1 Tax=Ureibacillus sinduriensis BLB-1 = JCM 15800 TaxID=1384057 RepID=A0A0A3I4H3_9BACL|nr:2-succinyl-5-enolpyruvyl-6-hydroxy-3-cyclohexene-1-carboxylic-acid synthase [Ureibacillus sinduriensis]KGR78410.1 2-succinyl-5-enolpyruvyl-6-hydroxy-3-cyclohexene-1-carboxylate synthase [Ureibacillus sinduriensis BLB-1 = JCM 15800]
MNEREILTNYVYKMVASLMQNGVEDVVISPGSRSTPLAYAFASTKNMSIYRQVDERSAAYFALGIAKAKANPVVLLCTSGTAAANYYPAIVEAKYARVPLIVITADRPHELREVGAPQAINQISLYGERVKWSAEFPIPDEGKMTLPYIERHIARGVSIATTAPFGPVHFNVPFREPLLIDFQEELPKQTFQNSFVGRIAPSEQAEDILTSIINQTKRGFIIVGELALGIDLEQVWAFIRKLKWPVLVESLSNLRTNVPTDCRQYIVSTYDALLRSTIFKQQVVADTVIRFGAQPVSKFLTNFLMETLPTNYIVVDEDPMFRDSTAVSTHFIHATIGEWISRINIDNTVFSEEYLRHWRQSEDLAVKHICSYLEFEQDEGAAVRYLIENLPDKSDLFVSSSMPIRDIDTFLLPTTKDIQVFANRGANGIDGVVSTAIGFSEARKDREMYLLIGDLAFLHDVNALIATRYQHCKINIIVFNNDGGGIFSYLAQSTVKEYYEDLFGTPTALTFSDVAKMYEMEYVGIQEFNEIEKIMEPKNNPLRLIEIFTDRQQNVASHRKLWQHIHEELEQ